MSEDDVLIMALLGFVWLASSLIVGIPAQDMLGWDLPAVLSIPVGLVVAPVILTVTLVVAVALGYLPYRLLRAVVEDGEAA